MEPSAILLASTVVVAPLAGRERQQRPDFKPIYALMRQIRVEAQQLQQSLVDIKQQADTTDPKVSDRDKVVSVAVQNSIDILNDSRAQIESMFKELEADLHNDADAADLFGDMVTRMHNCWTNVAHPGHWPVVGPKADDMVYGLGKLIAWLDDLVYQSALVTIPPRVNQHLRELRVGQTLAFHNTFQDELPVAAERDNILAYLHGHPGAVEGIVDMQHGLIYRASPEPMRRLLSYGFILGTVALGAIFTYWLPTFVASFGAPSAPNAVTNNRLLFGYLAVVLGGIVHIGIDALKQVKAAQSGTSAPMLAVDDWLTWVHVKELYIVAGVISYWIAFLGIVYYLQKVDFVTAFLAGYSADSFIDLFTQRFTKGVTAATTALIGPSK